MAAQRPSASITARMAGSLADVKFLQFSIGFQRRYSFRYAENCTIDLLDQGSERLLTG